TIQANNLVITIIYELKFSSLHLLLYIISAMEIFLIFEFGQFVFDILHFATGTLTVAYYMILRFKHKNHNHNNNQDYNQDYILFNYHYNYKLKLSQADLHYLSRIIKRKKFLSFS